LCWLLAALVMLFGVEVGAESVTDQSFAQSWQITTYAEAAGLGQQRVFDVAFGRDGTVWLAADSGLRRFDGCDWKMFGTNEGVPSTFVRAVMVNRQNQLWVGSDLGAGVFDPSHEAYNPAGSLTGLANSNVRQMDEDPDGTMWFSCDQWPDLKGKPGGLSCLADGHWRTFSRTDGLPMNYVIGYFRDSTGRQFALTSHGWAQRRGGAWGPPANPGYEAEDCVLQMAEAADGTLFAQGEKTLLLLKHDRWEPYVDGHTRLLCRTREGEMIAVECDENLGRLWFSRWDGRAFVPASAAANYPLGARFYHLREAPDGALWCVGKGTVIRWACHDERWQSYPHLLPPVGCDEMGRMWFADGSNVVVREQHQFIGLPPGNLMRSGWNQRGTALIWNPERQQFEATDPLDPGRRTPVVGHWLKTDTLQPDDEAGFWLEGHATNEEVQIAHYSAGRTTFLDTSALQGWRVTSCTAVAPHQLRVVAKKDGGIQYGLALVANNKIDWQPLNWLPPPLTYVNWVTGAGRNWLLGYDGLYEQDAAAPGPWRQVTGCANDGFSSSLMSSNEALFILDGGRSGKPGCALFGASGWKTLAGDFSHPVFARHQERIYLASRTGVFIRKTPGTLELEHLQSPAEMPVNTAVEDGFGDVWLGTADGVLRYHPGPEPPVVRVVASETEVGVGRPLPVAFASLHRFERQPNPEDYYYSWRVDDFPWSRFEPWRSAALALPQLSSGTHQLAVRSRDVDGNVSPVPAQLEFTVLPVPLQNQPWFLPLVVLVAGVLAWLVWLSLAHVRQIAGTNSVLRQEIAIRRQTEAELQRAREHLEQRVAERTEQWSRSNQLLKHEIAERQQAEQSKRQLEAQLNQAQKMEAIGTLAGGIAHDFNNILAIIIPYCDLCIEELSGRPELQESLGEALKAANRAKNLVQQILAFSRRQAQQRQVCELQPVVKEALKLLRSALPSSIQMIQKIDPTHPVVADSTQIHQVVMNLCVNAQHAMAGRQGQLEVRIDEVVADTALCERNVNLRPGLYVRLSVRDTGCGIAPENLARIFEPFFTTREVGQGTGLGLAVVHGIVHHHDGVILVHSQVGLGTEFQVLLPAHLETVAAALPAVPPVPPSHGEQILIVDDEEAIIKVLKRLLARSGYKVIAHVDPRAAFEDFILQPEDIHLVLTDLTMPGMNGLELAAKIYRVRPNLPVIIATGFSGGLITSAELAEHPNLRKVVEKPLQNEAIIRVISELLHPVDEA
jgi:signal transduction histidine kinase/CheY-like chemotaxis protein